MNARTSLRGVLALLLLVSAALFAVGTTLERHHTEASHQETTIGTPAPTEGVGETGTDEHPSASPSSEASPEATQGSGEKVLGINLESTPLIAIAVLASILLALAAWKGTNAGILPLILIFGLALAVLDVREVVHQSQEGKASLVALSVIVAVLHVGVAGLAGAIWRQERTRSAAPA